MPFLQFLNGGRDQEFEELHASASLLIGSGGDAQIKCSDTGVQAQHCQVYPADGKYWLRDLGAGSTVFKMRRIGPNNPPDIVPLEPGEVFIIGPTYVKFWGERPPASGGGGADPAALEAAQGEAESLKSELEQLKGELSALQSSGGEAASELERVKGELEGARGELEEAKGELETSRARVGELETELSEAQAAKSASEAALEEASAAHEQALSEAQAAAEEAVEAAKAEASQASAALQQALEATRGTLAGMRAEDEREPFDPLGLAAGESDLAKVVGALGLEGDLLDRLERAFAAEVERAVERRLEGPVVPVRGLRVLGVEGDVEQALARVKQRNQRLAVVKELGLGELGADELERLLELARS